MTTLTKALRLAGDTLYRAVYAALYLDMLASIAIGFGMVCDSVHLW